MARFSVNSIKAVFPSSPVSNGRRLDNKELAAGYTVVAHRDGEFLELVHTFVWTGRSRSASTVYAAIWVTGDDSTGRPYVSGSGSAGGYGYHKSSEAISRAIASAGIELYGAAGGSYGNTIDYTKKTDIGGVGESAIESALLAIGEACGYSLAELHLVRVA